MPGAAAANNPWLYLTTCVYGHEKDVSAIEQCSWLTPTPATPSGIGKYLQERYLNLQEQLHSSVTRLIHYFTNVHHREIEKINAFLKNIPARVSGNIRQREERFFSHLRGFEKSVTYTVRDHERRITILSSQLLEKIHDIRIKNTKNIKMFAAAALSRFKILNHKEAKQVNKAILRLDFEKRFRESRKQQDEIRRKARNLLAQALKKND
ncbi:MAG: hypothetical protein MUF15_19680, partial [Acidobacteria bacterium]|nr:hypothetical protein [Acidobacteriota bacterium]